MGIEFWGAVVAILFIVGKVAQWYFAYKNQTMGHNISQMNDRDKLR